MKPIHRSLLLVTVITTGCGRAPSVDVLGSFFPVWMLCVIIAVVAAFVVRSLLLRFNVEAHVGPLAIFYPSIVIFFSCLLWLVFFR
jgi:YtcA family